MPESKPNANIGAIFKSDVLSSFLNHEISKSIDHDLLFQGTDFPMSGILELHGEGVMRVAFSPNGGAGGINKNLIAPMIDALEYPYIGGNFFAFSSKVDGMAIYNAYEKFDKLGTPLVNEFTSDKPMAMQPWSTPLWLSGLKLDGTKEEKTLKYVDDPENPFVKNLSPEKLAKWRSGIRVASKMFQDGSVVIDGKSEAYTVKQHTKLIVAGNPEDGKNLTVAFGSFNQSDNAEKNQEVIALITGDSKINAMGIGAVKYQFAVSESSVYEEAMRRNSANDFDPPVGENFSTHIKLPPEKKQPTKTPCPQMMTKVS